MSPRILASYSLRFSPHAVITFGSLTGNSRAVNRGYRYMHGCVSLTPSTVLTKHYRDRVATGLWWFSAQCQSLIEAERRRVSRESI